MKLALKIKLFALISLSRIFNTLGASIYNIVFIVLVPTFFTIFVGMKVDK